MMNDEIKLINQGDVFWIQDEGSGLGYYPHPYVVVQDDLFNHSRVETVIVCALTSRLDKVSLPGNVLLEMGEAGLEKQSVVEVSKVSSVKKGLLGDLIGRLSEERIEQIMAGMRFLQESGFLR